MLSHSRGPLSDQLPPSYLVKLTTMSLASRDAYHNLFSFKGVGIREDGNSTCQQMTHCSTCVDLLTPEGSGCVWCNAAEGRTADGICLPRSSAQQRCTIEEIQTTCQEGVGWYVLILTLSALVCCCCFLTMARKFAEVWHERRWLAAAGDLTRPLLGGEDGEEQAHEAVFRGSLIDGTGTSWRCPVCGFDNRPLCKHCDLCGIGSDFAEAYWKDMNTPRRADGKAKQSTLNAEDDKPDPRSHSARYPSGNLGEASISREASEVARRVHMKLESAEETRVEMGGRGAREQDEKDNEDDSETASLLPATVVTPGTGSAGPIQSNSGVDCPSDDDGEECLSRRIVGAATSSGATSEKARVVPSLLRRPTSLTKRQKRARRRRVWQRVIGVDGKLRWLQTLESPAVLLPPPADTPDETASAAATTAAIPSGVPGRDSGSDNNSNERGVGESLTNRPPLATAETGGSGARRAISSATGVMRFISVPRLPRLVPPTSSAVDPSSEPLLEEHESTSGGGVDGVSLLSDVERGEGGFPQDGQGVIVEEVSSVCDVSQSPRQEENDAKDEVKGLNEEKADGSVKEGDGAEQNDQQQEEARLVRRDSFGDEGMVTKIKGYYITFLDGGGLAMDEALDGALVAQTNPPPPSATQKGPSAGEGTCTTSLGSAGTAVNTPAVQEGARGWGNRSAERVARERTAQREEAACEEWINSSRKNVAKLCEVAAKPFWQKHSWFLDQLRMLQVPHGAGMEAMRIEVNRKRILEDSFAQVSAMCSGELRRWLRVQFEDEPGVDAGGLEREWFLLICRALFDPSTGLFTPQTGDGAFTINPSSGLANELHMEYFRFTGRVLGKLLMEHSVAPFQLSLPILKHLLGLPVTFSDLEFVDSELHRNLCWLRNNTGAASLGLDFTVTLESFGMKEVLELVPGGKHIAVTDENKRDYLKLRLKYHMFDAVRGQLWHLMRGFYDVIPAHLISVFDYQELELLLCGIPEIDISEWKRHSRYMGEYRRQGEEHPVIKWFWEVLEEFADEDRARFLQFCTGTSRLPPHGFKALQSNDGSFRAFSLQSVTKGESAFPRAHTCFNKLDLPLYDNKKELEECLGLCICFELTGFTID